LGLLFKAQEIKSETQQKKNKIKNKNEFFFSILKGMERQRERTRTRKKAGNEKKRLMNFEGIKDVKKLRSS
jgi:hypothetical protein